MMRRLQELRTTIWTAKDAGKYNATCRDPIAVANGVYGGFMGPFCDLGEQ